jgi:molecular chaperone DnaK (HSP70)
MEIHQIASNDFCVSVPSYFTSSERQALLDAAKIAGIKLLRVYNESTANVMNYGIFRKGTLSKDKGRMVFFVDFGHSKTSIFAAKIWKDKAEILYEKNHRNLGVRNLDLNTFNYFAKRFMD